MTLLAVLLLALVVESPDFDVVSFPSLTWDAWAFLGFSVCESKAWFLYWGLTATKS